MKYEILDHQLYSQHGTSVLLYDSNSMTPTKTVAKPADNGRGSRITEMKVRPAGTKIIEPKP